jgi:protein KTI12
MYAMEKRTTAVVNAIRTFTTTYPTADIAIAQSDAADGIAIPVPDVAVPVLVPSHVALSGTTEELAGAGGVLALPRLQRLRRQWISLNRAYIGRGAGGLAADQIGDAFVRFLNAEFSGAAGEAE